MEIERKSKDIAIYDSAINEIEKNFGNFLYSSEMFDTN